MRKSSFSSLCRPETHFKDAQSPQWACTKIGFSIFIQKRNTAINRVEHQKSVDMAKKIEKRTIDLQKSSKSFLITTYKKKSRRTHNYRKKSYIALMKLMKRYQNIRYLISTSKFKKHTSKFSSRRLDVQGGETKMTTSCWFQSMQIWRRRNEAQLNTRCPDSLHSWSIHFWSKIENFSIKMHCEKNTI